MILQQRPIPGTKKLMAMIGGYHTPRQGKIGVIDITQGLENGAGVTLLAPVRLPKDDDIDDWGGIPGGYPFVFNTSVFPRPGARPLDQWGQNPPTFAYPYPFDDSTFLVSYRPVSKTTAWADRFGLYFMTADGQRELLYYDAAGSCCGAVVLAPRTRPSVLSSFVDYRQSTGTFRIMNLYDPGNSDSPVLDGIDPRIIKKIRVAGLEYRSGPKVGLSSHFGAGCINYGGATYHTPISVGSSSWDLKWIIGETPVLSDGSASFIVPARTPVYFQLLDSAGNAVQTMRSWSMVQPGETFTCMGCHESKLNASVVTHPPSSQPVPLTPFYGPARGFSFAKEVQPIFDAKCISCHSTATPNGIDLTGTGIWEDGTARSWLRSYSKLVENASSACVTKYVSWFPAEDSPLLLPPYRAGACKSPLVTLLASGHYGVDMTREEMDKIRCWIDLGVPHSGAYTEGMSAGDSANTERNLAFRRAWEAEEQVNIQAYIAAVGTGSEEEHQYKGSIPIGEGWMLTARYKTTGSLHVMFSVPRLANHQTVQINLYNIRGVLVQSFMKECVPSGYHSCSFPIHNSDGSGQYFVRLKAGEFKKVVPVVIFK